MSPQIQKIVDAAKRLTGSYSTEYRYDEGGAQRECDIGLVAEEFLRLVDALELLAKDRSELARAVIVNSNKTTVAPRPFVDNTGHDGY